MQILMRGLAAPLAGDSAFTRQLEQLVMQAMLEEYEISDEVSVCYAGEPNDEVRIEVTTSFPVRTDWAAELIAQGVMLKCKQLGIRTPQFIPVPH